MELMLASPPVSSSHKGKHNHCDSAQQGCGRFEFNTPRYINLMTGYKH